MKIMNWANVIMTLPTLVFYTSQIWQITPFLTIAIYIWAINWTLLCLKDAFSNEYN